MFAAQDGGNATNNGNDVQRCLAGNIGGTLVLQRGRRATHRLSSRSNWCGTRDGRCFRIQEGAATLQSHIRWMWRMGMWRQQEFTGAALEGVMESRGWGNLMEIRGRDVAKDTRTCCTASAQRGHRGSPLQRGTCTEEQGTQMWGMKRVLLWTESLWRCELTNSHARHDC